MSPSESWVDPRLEVGVSRVHGKGVFARAPIRRGERLAIFGGAVMWIDELLELPEALQDFPMQIEERFVLGTRNREQPEAADFFNHSCDPNAGFRGQIFLVALRGIETGEEVCFDYAMVVSESEGSDVVFEMDCCCGTALCRGKIAEDDWKLPQLQGRYKGYFSQYLQEKIDSLVADREAEPVLVRGHGR